MTILMNNWCPMCEEACHDHSSICTVCGTSLEAPPSRSTTAAPLSATNNNDGETFRLIPEFMTQDLRQAGRELRDVLSLSRSLANNDGTGTTNINDDGEWQAIPAELLNPQPTSSQVQPTSKAYLDRMPRFLLETNSSIFRQATMQLTIDGGGADNSSGTSQKISISLVPGEFGPSENCSFSDCPMIVASPRTGKGGKLSESTKQSMIQQEKTLGNQCIVYLERGDGVSFVQKAMLAQDCGAVAVVIGNSLTEPWPYVMQDSNKDGERLGLTIPVAMAKKEDGKHIVDLCAKNEASVTAKFEFQQLSRDCAICTESLKISEKILQLPACGHIFHEACAMKWLTKHHNCPYCRTLLPTDDRDGNTVMPNRGDSSLEWGQYYA
ncbi:unnamed protein product [Cylindrotheca closterium]|uniref:RING-type domain-containing protein n=1 Tax=Cylindrotheca closterium TaxID=2856 RepID=A0AAD2FXW1_9STRA|nr:unnamed protein product [Cylindrotheca closterium]